MKKIVFMLSHRYKYGVYKHCEEVKTIGFFYTAKEAKEVIDKLWEKEGFCDYPKNCFVIEKFTVDKDINWTDGFIIDEACGIFDTSEYEN